MPLKDLPFKIRFIEVPKDIRKIPFDAEFLSMKHADPTIGIRLELDGKIISYCPDTGYCDNTIKLSKDADLVIAECAIAGKSGKEWPHLNPEAGARIAKEAGAKKLVMAHFGADDYKDFKARDRAQKRARRIFRNSYSSRDGMQIKV